MELKHLTRIPPIDHSLAEVLTAEAIYRESISRFSGEFMSEIERLSCVDDYQRIKTAWGVKGEPKLEHFGDCLRGLVSDPVAQRAGERLATFWMADGLIPVVCKRAGACEAIPIPFCLRFETSVHPGAIDLAECPIPKWEQGVRVLRKELKEPGLVIQVLHALGPRVNNLHGNSFQLPVCLAYAQKKGRVSGREVFHFLATGAVSAGCIRKVDALDEKLILARKLGLVFVGPGLAEGEGLFPIQSGAPLIAVWSALGQNALSVGRVRITGPALMDLIRCLRDDLHNGAVSLKDASRKWAVYTRYLSKLEADSPYRQEAQLELVLLKGVIQTHSGSASKAVRSLAKAFKTAITSGVDNLSLIKLMAHQIVALTDIGRFEAAEVWGCRARRELGKKFRGKAEDRIRAKMTLNGVLGGQVFLQKGLLKSEYASQSRVMLVKALEDACHLRETREILRDRVQLYLWEALYRPADALLNYRGVEQDLLKVTPDDRWMAHQYLKRHRWLAAYRLILSGLKTEGQPEEWDLPEPMVGPAGWIRATALKYRATWRARLGDYVGAKTDFDASLGPWTHMIGKRRIIICREPLIRFISGTIAHEACRSLSDSNARASREYRDIADMLFEGCIPARLKGPFSARQWQVMNAKEWVNRSQPVRPDLRCQIVY
jgi:hypothetical protein